MKLATLIAASVAILSLTDKLQVLRGLSVFRDALAIGASCDAVVRLQIDYSKFQ